MNYLITGGTGFIGSYFIQSLASSTDKIIILTRAQKISKENIQYIHSLDEIKDTDIIDVIINLAGSPIDRRWSMAVKKDLISSRIDTTQSVVSLINRLENKPEIFLSASAVGYYGHYPDKVANIDENTLPNRSFTNELCSLWEQTAMQATEYDSHLRVCIMRFGVVLAKDHGFIKKITLPFKCGLGGKLGTGEQIFPWIHIDDVISGMHFLIENAQSSGAYNFVAPDMITNLELTNTLGEILNRPVFFGIPSMVIRLLFREMGEELLLKGNKIHPKKLIKDAYKFRFSNIKTALLDIFCS